MNLAKIIQKQRRKLVERLNEKDEVFKEQQFLWPAIGLKIRARA